MHQPASVATDGQCSQKEQREMRHGGRLLSRIAFTSLYTCQLVGSVIFLRWLIVEAWNESAPAASALFFVAELIAFVSSSFFLSNALFIWVPQSTKEYSSHGNSEPTDQKENEITFGDHTELDMTDFEMTTSGHAFDFEEAPETEKPTVAVCVCRYKEPIEDLLQTVQSLDEILWPSSRLQLYILDDGWYSINKQEQKAQLDGLYGILGSKDSDFDYQEEDVPEFPQTPSITRPDCATSCTYLKLRDGPSDTLESLARNKSPVTLIARQKPEDSHYKAGNLNNFLYNYLAHQEGAACPTYALILDHDMLPHPNIVADAVKRHEQDKNLAFVQYPQRFYDLVGSDAFYAGNEIFFDGVQVNRGHVGLASFAGTNAMWRLQALYHVGGLQYGSLTEDTSTGLAAHSIGYTSSYSQLEMAVGQSPQTVKDAMQQRMRWSQGAIEICLKYVGAYCRGKSPVEDISLPPNLAGPFDLTQTRPTAPSFFRKCLIFVVYIDSMIYPLYSMGYILHAIVCASYLITAEAPMNPSKPITTLLYWLPLYTVKCACQLSAFPMVSLSTEWNSSMAWAGYSLTTLVSVMKAFWSKLNPGRGGSGWFNTGGGGKERFLLQYGNTAIAAALYVLMLYRAFAFLFKEDAANAWMSIGALLYGCILLLHVQGWAIEPFRNHEERNKTQNERNKTQSSLMRKESFQSYASQSQRTDSLHNLALMESQKHRDVHHSFSLGLIFMFVNVVVFSFVLFYWGTHGSNQESLVTNTVPDVEEDIPWPPLSTEASFPAEFIARDGKIFLNDEQFHVKGANWFGFETTRNVAFGIDQRPQDAVLKRLVEEGFNALRIPLAVESVLNPTEFTPPEWAVDKILNPHLKTDNYLSLLQSFVDRAAAWGVFVLLDMHLLRNDRHPDPLPYDDETPLSDVNRAWSILAERFCDTWSVMGADLKNEPIDVTWGGGGNTDWRLIAEELAGTVTSNCQGWLIFVEGVWRIDESPLDGDDFPTWGSTLVNAGEIPVRIFDQEKLVYSPHLYGPGTVGENDLWRLADEKTLRCKCSSTSTELNHKCLNEMDSVDIIELRNQTSNLCQSILPLPEFPFPSNMASVWDYLFGYLQDQGETIIVGEWGGTYVNTPFKTHNLYLNGQIDSGDFTRQLETEWNEAFVTYLLSKGIGSFFWSVNPESDDTGGLFLDDWKSLDTAKIDLLHRLPSTDPMNILDPVIADDTLEACLLSSGVEALMEDGGGYRYESESVGYNSAFDNVYLPKAIVFPKTEEEVQDVVDCAAPFKVGLCPRSGGHSYTGDSSCTGIIVDVVHLREIERVDEATFWVGTGNMIGQIATAMLDHDRLIPTGNHGGVGTGFFLGCGYGFLSRAYGLGCDNIVAARIATASGEILEVRDDNAHADLLWSLRGAGAGQFGVVTSMLLKTHPLPASDAFSYFKLTWPRSLASEAVSVWQDWALEHPNFNFTCRLTLWNPSEEVDFDSVHFDGVLYGDLEELDSMLQIPQTVLGPPNEEERGSFEYGPLLARLYGIPDDDVLQLRNPAAGYSGERRSFHNMAHLVPREKSPLNDTGISDIVRFTNEQLPGAKPYTKFLSLTPLGGLVPSQSLPSAFGHRNSTALVQYGGYWETPSEKFAVVRHQRHFHETMTEHWGSDSFYNYKSHLLQQNWEQAYWGNASVPKLQEVKCKYDPDGIFSTSVQSIVAVVNNSASSCVSSST